MFVLLFNTFTSLHPSAVSVAIALEEEEYSVSSLVLAFKNLKFWSIYRPSEEPKPIEETEPTQYVVGNDDKETSPLRPAEAAATATTTKDSNTLSQPIVTNSETLPSSGTISQAAMPESLQTESPKATNAIYFAKKMLASKDNRIASSHCSNCASKSEFLVDEDEEYRQRIEFIKEQILTRLGMKRPPKLCSQPNIDLGMYMRIAENTINQRELADFDQSSQLPESTEAVEEVDKVFILPTRRDQRNLFDLSTVDTAGGSKKIKSIYILVNFNLTEYYYGTLMHNDKDLLITSQPTETSENDISQQMGIRFTTSPLKKGHTRTEQNFDSAHWFQYDVTSELSDFSGHIQIGNDNFEINSSVIVLEMTNHKVTRAKRSIDCTDRVSFCCRQPFYVNFTTIGWNNWIFQPAGYNANYCKGKCDLSHARYHHTTVIGKYPAIKLCCSPREMSSISLIYMDDKFNIYQKNLPNMVVKSCDCA